MDASQNENTNCWLGQKGGKVGKYRYSTEDVIKKHISSNHIPFRHLIPSHMSLLESPHIELTERVL